MSWFVAALLSTLFFIFYDILPRILSVRSKNPRAFSVVYNSFCSLIVLGLLLLERPSLAPVTFPIIFLTLVATVLWGLFNRVEFYAHKYVEVSLRTIIGKLAPLVTFFVSAVFLSEAVTGRKLLATVLVLGSNILVLYKKDRKIESKGLIYALATSIALGLAWAMDKKVSVFYPTSFYLLISYSIPTLYILVAPLLSMKVIREEFKLASWKVVLLSLINVAGYYFLVRAFALGEASKTTLVGSSKSVLSILVGIFILNERSDVGKKILAGVIATVGVLLLK